MKEQNNLLSDTKKRIIETAGKVFAELGFQNATVREICRQAGVNIAAINYHFGDKKGLYLAVIKYGRDIAFQKYPLDISSEKSSLPEERLKDFVSRFVGRVWECHEGEIPWVRKLIVQELLRPTEGLDMVAEETVKPIFKALSTIVRELLGSRATEDTVNLCCASIVGQSLFFFYAQPMIKRLFPTNNYIDTKLIANHITHFSLNAIEKFAAHKKRRQAMNPSGLERSAKTRCKVIRLIVVFGFTFFTALSGSGEEALTESPEKIAKTTFIENSTPGPQGNRYNLVSIISYALKNNPNLRIAERDIEVQKYGVDAAKADRIPRIDLGGGIARFRYDTPLTPVVITPPIGAGTDFPVVRRTIWDTGVSFKLPLFKGGRLYRAVHIAEMKREIAQDTYRMNKQELIYNLTSVYYKIVQFEKLLLANDQSVKQLESHKKNVELYLKTGTVPKLDLLKTDVEFSHALESRLIVKNNLASAYELLKALMGMDDMDTEISIVSENTMNESFPALEESMKIAFSQRSDYKAVAKKRLIGEERVKIAEGKRFPDIFATGEYVAKAGNYTAFKENWNYGVRFTIPLFDGGLIRSEINKEKTEMEKTKEEERAIKLLINREVRDAHLNIANTRERIEVTQKAIESAQENVRIESLKYDTGAGMSTDVIDAQTALLRAETDYYQALFDRETAFAYLKKAVGEDEYDGEVRK